MTLLKAPRRIYLLLALAILGAALSIALTQHYYTVHTGAAGFKSFCNISDKVNCDVVAASPYAELAAGIPLSSFAAGWFLALFVVALFLRNPQWKRDATRVALFLTGFGTLMSLGYLAIMAFVLKTYCLLCLAVDATTLVALLIVISLKPEGFSQHKPNLSQWKTLLGLATGSLFVMVLALKGLEGATLERSMLHSLIDSTLATAPVSVNTGDEFPSIGPKDAPITIVEFSDFQCPYCRMGAVTLNAVMNRYPSKVRVVFRNFPLDNSCNKDIEHGMHPVACEAARAAICAHKQGKFKSMYEHLFDKQASLAPRKPVELAAEIGVDASTLQGCMGSPEVEMAITRDIGEAKQLGVRSTPCFFINGHKVEGAIPAEAWNGIIERLLSATPK